MGGKVTETELARFASWLEWGQPKGEPGPYLKYFREQGDAANCYHTYNPFDMEKRVWEAFQSVPDFGALMVLVSEKKGFTAQLSQRATRLHKGLYSKYELWPLPGGKRFKIEGFGQVERRDDEFNFGVAMLTAVIYQRAAENYPGAIFYTTDRWPAVVRIH